VTDGEKEGKGERPAGDQMSDSQTKVQRPQERGLNEAFGSQQQRRVEVVSLAPLRTVVGLGHLAMEGRARMIESYGSQGWYLLCIIVHLPL